MLSFGGQVFEWASVEAGVQQGSILGPLCLLYINDIVRNIVAYVRPFADDTSLYIVVDSPLSSAAILNTDLNTIANWPDALLVRFQNIKCLRNQGRTKGEVGRPQTS